jgi:serine/threonine protein kinase
MNISHNNTYSNINANRNTNYFINIISNNKNTHNLNQQYLVNNNNNIKLDSIRKALLQNGEANTFHKKDKTESSKSSNLNANNINIKNERTIKSDEIIKIYLKNEKNEEPKENFKPREFIFIKILGEGTYGKIFLTQWKKNNKNYAIKKEIIKGSESLIKKREKTKIVTNFIKKTGSKGVIKIYGDLYKKKGNEYYYYVLMEIAEKDWDKELFERKKKKLYYSENEIFIIMNQLIKTLSLLQKNHITHRDIKPQNILISNGIYKISDFGEARTLVREGVIVARVRGTELYMSPTLFNGLGMKLVQVSHNTFKSDVFSLGMCIFFAASLTLSSIYSIRELSDIKLIKKQLIKYLSGRYSYQLINIVNEMLQIDENYRPDFITLEKKYFP